MVDRALANRRSAGFQACCIAGFQTCRASALYEGVRCTLGVRINAGKWDGSGKSTRTSRKRFVADILECTPPGQLGRLRATRTLGRFGNLRYSRFGNLRYVAANWSTRAQPQSTIECF